MAMLKNKHITLSIILVCLLVVSPMTKAQLGLGGLLGGILGGSGGSGGSSGSGGLLGGILGGSGGSGGLLGGILGGSGGSGGLLGGILGGSGGSGGLLGGILGATGGLLGGLNKANIQGVLFCTLNGSLSLDTASTPVFPNADIQLQCGKQNTVVSSTTTTAAGIFSIPPNTIQMLFSTLLSECNLAVKTPLSSCNVTLPSIGNLVSPLTVVGSTVSRVGNVINLSPAGFLLTG